MKKFLSYVLTFVVMFVISAATTVYISRSGDESVTDPMVSVGGGTNSSFFTGVMGTFEEESRFSVDGTLEIENGEIKVPLDILVNADITDMSNLKFDGYISFEIKGQTKIIYFSFCDSTIYLSYANVDIKITMATINTLIEEISNLIKTEVPSEEGSGEESGESGPSFIESLIPDLMAALNNIKETNLENGDKKVELVVDGLARVEAITTEDNKSNLLRRYTLF